MAVLGGWKTRNRRWMGWAAFAAAMAAAWLVAGGGAWALRLPGEEQPLLVRIHGQWNRQYLCLAARVPDSMLTGTSAGPMSAPEQDDAVEFSFEVVQPSGLAAYRFVVSAAGGMTLFARDARGHWRSDPSWVSGPRTVKYAVTTDGTLNEPSDEDVGFLVECAIPWEFLGGEPTVGREIGFNVVCWMQGESEGVASWSPTVRSPEHVGDAARWGRLLVSTSSALAKAQGAWIPCPYVGQTPFVDGKLAANEWLAASTLEFEKPRPTLEPAPPPGERTGTAATVLAVYRYDWQGDPGREGGGPLWAPDGAPATSDQPREGAGPWYSYERVDWHGQQLEEIQRAGIDVILARYRGDEDARRSWARIGLDRLGQALKERRAAGRGYPLVGMMLDTEPLEAVDLKSEEGKRLVYGMVREFFLHVPREFWAEVGARPEEGFGGGVPVLLGEPGGLADWLSRFLPGEVRAGLRRRESRVAGQHRLARPGRGRLLLLYRAANANGIRASGARWSGRGGAFAGVLPQAREERRDPAAEGGAGLSQRLAASPRGEARACGDR
jgi:hypothetical protein